MGYGLGVFYRYVFGRDHKGRAFVSIFCSEPQNKRIPTQSLTQIRLMENLAFHFCPTVRTNKCGLFVGNQKWFTRELCFPKPANII